MVVSNGNLFLQGPIFTGELLVSLCLTKNPLSGSELTWQVLDCPLLEIPLMAGANPKKRWNWEQTRALWFSWNGYIDVVSLINFSGWFLFGSPVKSNEWTLDLSDCRLDPHFLALKNSWSQKGPMQHKLPWGAHGVMKLPTQRMKLWKENPPTLSYSCIVWSSPQWVMTSWPLFHDRELFGILGGLTVFLGVRDSSSTADGYSWWIVISRWDVCPTLYRLNRS